MGYDSSLIRKAQEQAEEQIDERTVDIDLPECGHTEFRGVLSFMIGFLGVQSYGITHVDYQEKEIRAERTVPSQGDAIALLDELGSLDVVREAHTGTLSEDTLFVSMTDGEVERSVAPTAAEHGYAIKYVYGSHVVLVPFTDLLE